MLYISGNFCLPSEKVWALQYVGNFKGENIRIFKKINFFLKGFEHRTRFSLRSLTTVVLAKDSNKEEKK